LCIKQLICKAAENTLQFYPKRIRNEWFDDECKDALEVCNTARMKMLQRETRANIQAYRNAQRDAKLICKRKKKQHGEQVLEDNKKGLKIMTYVNFMKEYTRSWEAFNQEPPSAKINKESYRR
jgi:hypothetical protein